MVNKFAADVEAAVAAVDVRETQVFEARKIPTGFTLARLLEYVELGEHLSKSTKDSPEGKLQKAVHMVFELLGEDNIRVIEKDDGTKITVYDRITVYGLHVSVNDKANYKKLFDTMTGGNEKIGSFLDMVGSPFIVEVFENKSEDGTRTYYNIRDKGVWKIGLPVQRDHIAKTTTVVPVPDGSGNQKALIQGAPSQLQWDSLFIDGTFDKSVYVNGKDTGEKETVSKNWIQEKCLQALDFTGSELEGLIGASELSLPVEDTVPDTSEMSAAEADAVAEQAAEDAKEDPLKGLSLGGAQTDLTALGLNLDT